MRRLIGKSGSGHFEMIISFVFFVGFVFFLFVVLKPQDSSTLSVSVIRGFHDSFEEEVHTNLSMVYLRANYTGAGSCFEIVLPEEIFEYNVGDGESYVVDLEGVDVDSGLSGGSLDVGSRERDFRVSVSPEFEDEGLSGCDSLTSYRMGGVVEKRVVSYNALVEMKDRYYDDYDSLKSDLRIPGIFDFAIDSENLGEVLMEPPKGVLGSTNVVARDYLMEVLYSNGTVVGERFNLKIW